MIDGFFIQFLGLAHGCWQRATLKH